jgi:hypothetical protein
MIWRILGWIAGLSAIAIFIAFIWAVVGLGNIGT